MRISDWSSDVCSSDLAQAVPCTAHRRDIGDPRVIMADEAVPQGVAGFQLRVPADMVEPEKVAFRRRLRICEHPGDRRRILGDRVAAGFRPVEADPLRVRSEEHTSELQSLMRISYAVF